MKIKIKLTEIRAVAIFASRDESRYVLNGIHCETGKHTVLTATDGRCLGSIQIEASEETSKGGFIIPSAAVSEIISTCRQKKADDFQIWKRGLRLFVRIDGQKVFSQKVKGRVQKIKSPDKTRTVLIFDAIDGNYPNWRQVVPTKFGTAKHYCLSAFIATKVIAASRIISPKEPAMQFFFSDEISATVVKFHAAKNFIIVAMPMRMNNTESETIPAFAKP